MVEDKWLQPSSVDQRRKIALEFFRNENSLLTVITGTMDGTDGTVAKKHKKTFKGKEVKPRDLYCFKTKGGAFNAQVCAYFQRHLVPNYSDTKVIIALNKRIEWVSDCAPFRDNVDINMVKKYKKELLACFKPNVDAILADKGYVSEEVASWGVLKALPKLRRGQEALNERDQVTMKHLVDVRSKLNHTQITPMCHY